MAVVLAMLASSSPAAAPAFKGAGSEWKADVAFRLKASGIIASALSVFGDQQNPPDNKEQEKQSDRDARVFKIEIIPGDTVAILGQRISFAAVAYDKDGNTVGGVEFKWQAKDTGRQMPARISPRGDFEARLPGKLKIRVDGAGKKAEVTVDVLDGVLTKRDKTKETTKDVSSHDLPSGVQTHTKVKKSSTTVSPNLMPEPGYGDSNYWSADDPGNRVGDPPGAPSDGGAGSGNFQISAPVLSLAGRGINLSLDLNYNSRLWNKAGSQITYDIDKDWPGPGWSLGLGKLIGMGVNNGSMIVDADGTRHSYTGTVYYGYNNSYTIFNGHTTDGKFIDYSHQTGTGGALVWGEARLSDGTTIQYGASSQGALYPTRITDANGNYITIAYVNNSGPKIQTITDTLGRAINFHYDGYGLLTAITGPGLGGSTQTLVRLHYQQLFLSYGFSGLTPVVSNGAPWVVDAIYYPGTGTGLWFGDTDSYSSYGMIAKVSERRAMSLSASSLNEQGSVSSGLMSKQDVYNYPMSPNYSLTDAPTYTTKTETWDGIDTGPAVTTYSIQQNATPRRVEVNMPNGARSVQLSFNAPGQFNDGLVYDESAYDSAGNLLQKTTTTWAQGAYNSPRPSRAEITDERGQVTASEYDYGTVYNQLTSVRNYGYGATLLRTTRTEYENGAAYTNRHIFNLQKAVEILSPAGTRVSRIEYQFDGAPLANAPGVVMHDDTHNPFAPVYLVPGYCYYECYDYCYPVCEPDYYTTDYNPATDYRGNVTQITKYTDAANLGGPIVETRSYDINGNMIAASTSCCEQTSFNYTSATQFAHSLSKTNGSPSDSSAQVTISSTFDFNTGLTLSTTDANGRTAQTTYLSDSLRPQYEYLPTGAYTAFSYDDVAIAITQTTYTAGGAAIASQNVKRLNGLGRLRREEALTNGGWDIVETRYDVMGRIWQQSSHYRNGVDQPRWTEHFYDALGRVTKVRAPDGSETTTYYNEPSRPDVATAGAQGQTTRVVDAWGKEMWARADADGELVEVVEPNPTGNGSVMSGGLVTSYTYDTMGNVTGVTQGDQQRAFRFDSLGRLTHQKMAEQSATLNDAGQYVGAGQWSEVVTYDDRSNLTSSTDARGVKTVYGYNNDALGRLRSVSYDTSGFGDTGNPIAPAASINYDYVTSGDVMRLSRVTASGVSTEDYAYDSEGRIASKTVTLTSRPSHPMVIDFIYDSLNRITDERYPAQYGFGFSARKVVHTDYDVASRLSGLQVDGASYASQINYNAASQATSVTVGSNQATETYTYDSVSGLLANQKVQRTGATILDLSYDYLRPNTSTGRTGQLSRISNNLDHNKDRSYTYDAVGRLVQATGGPSLWTQNYSYDRYGNRTSVTASGSTATTPGISCSATQTLSVEQFVRDFYQRALNRQPGADELNHWTGLLRQAYRQGGEALLAASQNMGWRIFQSQEYANRGRSDRDYVYDLYWAYLRRTPDQGGWDYWTSVVPSNNRDNVRRGFDFSTEFENVVKSLCPSASASAIPRDGLASLSFSSTSNRVTTPGFTYDAAGNQTRAMQNDGGWQRFQYDAAGRLVNVKNDSGFTLAAYTYGPSNQRLITQDGDGGWNLRTYYVWAGDEVIAEYNESRQWSSSPQWAKSNVYMGSRLLATLQPNGGIEDVQYHHPDRLGTRLITSASDTTVQEQVNLPFGMPLDAESTGGTKKRFTSYDRSAMTGLDYAVNRHYDSGQGRFTQVDPLGMRAAAIGQPQTLNMYSYCGNDPINRLDPDGMFWGKIKNFFKKVGKIFSAIGNAIAKVLNNRWVRIGVFIASFLVGLPGLGVALKHALQIGLKIYQTISNYASTLQLYGMLLQGKVREFGTSIGLGLLSAAIGTLEEGIKQGILGAIKRGNVSLGSIWRGATSGFHKGWLKLRHNLFGRGIQSLVPFYGNFCSPGNVDSQSTPAVSEVDGLCKVHDEVYQGRGPAGVTRFQADLTLLSGMLSAHVTRTVTDRLLSIAFGQRVSAGETYRNLAIPAFFGLASYRLVTGRGR